MLYIDSNWLDGINANILNIIVDISGFCQSSADFLCSIIM